MPFRGAPSPPTLSGPEAAAAPKLSSGRAAGHNAADDIALSDIGGPGMTPPFKDREKTFWTFQIIGWFGYACVRIFHGLTIDWGLDYFDTTAVATGTGFALSTVMRYLYRPVRTKPLPLVVAAAIFFCIVFALIFSAVEVTAASLYAPGMLVDYGLFDNAMFDGFVLLAWSGLYFGFHYYQQLQAQREATLKAAAMAHQAQLAMLRYQLNPHFLFNTLNAISTLVLARDSELANRMVSKLAAFLRYTLVNQPDQKVTLEQELYALGLYLDIEKVRFDERLTTDFDVEERARQALIPSLLLQPLVENAVKYAVAPSEAGGTIAIKAQVKGGRLSITVSDDGPGMDTAEVKPLSLLSSGVGLKNTKARLEEIYGPDHSLSLENREPSGLAVMITLPRQSKPAQQAAQ